MQPHLITSQDAPLKCCTKCGESKPATLEFFSNQKKSKDGLYYWCKSCASAHARAYYAANRAKQIERSTRYSEAHRERLNGQRRARYAANKSISRQRARKYYLSNRSQVLGKVRAYRESNLEKIRAYRAANRERFLEKGRAYREANRERLSERVRSYREANRERINQRARELRATNIEQVKQKRRAFLAANRERLYAQMAAYRKANPELYRRLAREYAKANPEKRSATQRNRIARQRAANGTHTAVDVKRQHEAQKGCCYWCGKKVGDAYHVDHVIPLARGGSNGPENLVIACGPCNQSKHDKLPTEWDGNRSGRLI